MRTLQLLIAFLALLTFQTTYAEQTDLIPDAFFSVSLPFEKQEQRDDQNKKTHLDEKAKEAMEVLLLRLTGQKRFVRSTLGQRYIQQANRWLANYNIKPRYEDGVEVGKNIQLNFDALRIKRAFAKQYVKLWAVQSRPKTLVMGSFVQQGRLLKLTAEPLSYRVDIDFREYPEAIELPYFVPNSDDKWIFPIEPQTTRAMIQENLIAHDQQNLLSFKLSSVLVSTNDENRINYTLDWFLFDITGAVLYRNSQVGDSKKELMKDMFSQLAQTYVKRGAAKAINKNQLILNVDRVYSADIIYEVEAQLKAQQPMIRSASLNQIKGHSAQYKIEYQGDINDVLSWLKVWDLVNYLGQTDSQTVSVNIK